jgi:murein tripeptide amidase MpaA
MDVNRYFTNDDLEQTIQAWSREYPSLLEIRNLGLSYENRPVWIMIITNRDSGSDLNKPAIWIDANIHATEITGTTAALKIAAHLLESYNRDPQITRLVDQCVYYIVPRINPDGAALALAPHPKYIRSGVRPYPWEDKEDGLHAEDIDDDGRILQMRIPDPNGNWKISSLDPRLMERREPDEQDGSYFRLFPEGLIDNYDGFQIKIARPLQGLDFNRNFPFQWRPEGEQSGAGAYPASEPEIKNVLDFIVRHPNINLAITFHTFSRVILRPYSTKPDEDMDTSDLWVMKKIGEIGSRITGYRCVSTFHDFKYHPKEVTTGAFDDWMYDHLGIYCYTIELWDLPTEAGIKDRKFTDWWREHPHDEDKKIIQWVDANAPAGSYIEWYPYQHPQLGAIELGGWDSMFTWRNPPLSLLKQETDRHIPYMVALAEMLPHLSLAHLSVENLKNGSYRIHLVVENTGFLPTFTSEMGKNRKAARPVRVDLEIPDGVLIVSGERRLELGHLEGRSNKLDSASNFANTPTDNRGKVEWVVQAASGTQLIIHVRSERAGSIDTSVVLV